MEEEYFPDEVIEEANYIIERCKAARLWNFRCTMDKVKFIKLIKLYSQKKKKLPLGIDIDKRYLEKKLKSLSDKDLINKTLLGEITDDIMYKLTVISPSYEEALFTVMAYLPITEIYDYDGDNFEDEQ